MSRNDVSLRHLICDNDHNSYNAMIEIKPIIYRTVEEKRAAFMRAVNQRHEWEARMRQKIAELDGQKQVANPAV